MSSSKSARVEFGRFWRILNPDRLRTPRSKRDTSQTSLQALPKNNSLFNFTARSPRIGFESTCAIYINKDASTGNCCALITPLPKVSCEFFLHCFARPRNWDKHHSPLPFSFRTPSFNLTPQLLRLAGHFNSQYRPASDWTCNRISTDENLTSNRCEKFDK